MTIPSKERQILRNACGSNVPQILNALDSPVVYADATARDAALPSPDAGQTVFNTALGALQTYTGSFWRTAGRSVIEDLEPDLYMNPALGIGVAPGAAVTAWRSRDGLSFAEATNQPDLSGSVANLNGRCAVTFNGTDDQLVYAGVPLTGTVGTVIVAYLPLDTGAQALFSIANAALTTDAIHLEHHSGGPYLRVHGVNTVNTDAGSVTAQDSPMVSTFMSTGDAYRFRAQGVEITGINVGAGANDGKWFGDLSSPTRSAIGVEIDSTPNAWANASIYKIAGWDRLLSAGELAAVEAELMAEIGASA